MNKPAASKSDATPSKHENRENPAKSTIFNRLLLLVPPLVAVVLVAITMRHHERNEIYFTNSAYYLISVMLATYLCIEMCGLGPVSAIKSWLLEHRFGLVLTAAIVTTVVIAVTPGYRVLADEANLIGVSKSLLYQRLANFATTGKWYFENFWSLNFATDRRPTLFPYLVSVLHALRGYHPENGFHLNAIIFVFFVFSAYRLAKGWGGELLGLATAILVATNPNTLIATRSAGFDLLSCFMLLLVFRGFVEFSKQQTPRRLAIFAMQLCLLAHVRYEGWALMLAAAAVLVLTRMIRKEHFVGYEYLYSFLPIFLLPRYWQAVAKAHDAEQPLSAALFSTKNLIQNTREYFGILRRPLDIAGPHSPLLLFLAIGGCLVFLAVQVAALRRKKVSSSNLRYMLLAVVLIGAEFVISFSYDWGKSLHPSSCRLFIWLDTVVAFAAAWMLTLVGRQFTMHMAALNRQSAAPATLVSSLALFTMHIPVASEARFTNSLVLTRQAAVTWRFFDKLQNKNILILTDRPGLYTIKDYGALDISSALVDRGPLLELSRRLYEDVYVVQEVDLNNNQPMQQFNVWPDVPKETVLEFQNTDSTSVRIAKLKR